MLFVSPQGRVAYWAGWTLLGLSKEQYTAVHNTFMILFVTMSVWHTVLNWRPIVGYLKNRAHKLRIFTPESAVALALTALFLGGTLMGLSPFRQFLAAGASVKAYWETSAGAPPWGHAEESTLDRFCRGMEDAERVESQRLIAVDCSQAVEALRAGGMTVTGTDQRIIEIARTNATTPQALARIIMTVARPLTPDEAAARMAEFRAVRFQRPRSGLGRMTLASYAEAYGYDLAEIRRILGAAGYEVDPEGTFRSEATRLGTDPEGLIEVLNSPAAANTSPGNPGAPGRAVEG